MPEMSDEQLGTLLRRHMADGRKPLGTQTFHLLDAMAYAPDGHQGQKMYVRGLLIKLPGEQRMTISALEMLSPTCRE